MALNLHLNVSLDKCVTIFANLGRFISYHCVLQKESSLSIAQYNDEREAGRDFLRNVIER